MIRLASYRPEYFNNNGDQGNLEVLLKQLAWRGVDAEVTQEIEQADFLLFGDASRAAMRQFSEDLEAQTPLLNKRLSENLPTLLVGSCHEFFAEKLNLCKLEKLKRSSEFREVETEGVRAFGYRNSDVDVDLVLRGYFASTTLFGPVLAKSPELLARMLEGMGVVQQLPAELAYIDDLVREIRSRAISG